MHRLPGVMFALFWSVAALAEPLHMSFEIHGSTPLHEQATDSPAYGMVGAFVWVGEPLIATVSALNVPSGDLIDWIRYMKWSVTSESGDSVTVKFDRDWDSPLKARSDLRKRSDVAFANFKFGPLPPGRYIIALGWTDPETNERKTASKRHLAIYRGNESPFIRSYFLRREARSALSHGTFESFSKARTMLLQAADGNTDPSVYEELGDAAAPWALPDETANYYQLSLEIAKKNLEKNLGPQKDWSAKAWHLYRPHESKVKAFRALVPYYRTNFDQVRVLVVPDGMKGKFVIERRSDGARLRVIDPQQ